MPSLCRTKHNRAKPMFELPSAIFLIADGNEFRFARFYIVCEEVPLGTPESPPIVSGVSDMHPSVSKRGRDTESDAVIRLEEIHTFFSNECFLCSSTRNLHHVLPVILLITKRGCTFDAQPLFHEFVSRQPVPSAPVRSALPDFCSRWRASV